MSPLQPWALALGALALPLVAAYFHRRRKTPLRVPSAMLYRVIAGQTTPRSRAMAKPRHLVSLFLMLLTLIGLVLALLDPQRDDEEPRNYVVVLDTSASMGAVAIGEEETRLAQAVDLLEDSVGRLGQQDRVALITADDRAIVRVGLTEDHGRVIEMARSMEPAGTSDGAPSALRIADAMCHANEHAAVVLISDGVGVSAPSTRCPIEHVSVGRIGPNVGISALSVREADALGLAEVYLAISSDLNEPTEVEVQLEVDGELAEMVPVDLPASGETKRLLRIPMAPGRRVTAQLQGVKNDVLAADDIAWAPRRLGNRVRALLVTDTRLSFTAEALRLHPRVDLSIMGPTDQTPDEFFDLVILEAERPLATLPASSHLVVLGVPATALGFAAEPTPAQSPEIVRWSFDDPLFRFVSFDEVQVPEATIFSVSEGQTALIDTDAGPVAVAGTFEDRRVIAFGFLPHHSDFVLRVGFVNLVANIVEWAAPPLGAAGEELEAFALPSIESHIDPPPQVQGTTRGEWSGPVRGKMAPWRTLAWLAAALLALEWLLPGIDLALRTLWARLGRGRRRRPRRKKAA